MDDKLIHIAAFTIEIKENMAKMTHRLLYSTTSSSSLDDMGGSGLFTMDIVRVAEAVVVVPVAKWLLLCEGVIDTAMVARRETDAVRMLDDTEYTSPSGTTIFDVFFGGLSSVFVASSFGLLQVGVSGASFTSAFSSL